jgi:predicted Zn-dependent peptidase
MKKTIFILLSLFFNAFVFSQENPLKVETYILPNGLTVYLNIDHSSPMVSGMVAVKGGAKRDPKDATGIAHYFEHIMFKGTDEIGTINYTEEKIYLDSISMLYDKLGTTSDLNAKLAIQKEINRVSLKAANYAIPNEFDKILNEMGSKDINAGTSYESIVYYNSFPSNQVEKWLEVYSHRFEHPVFRLFQSELETVYEEKNMYSDNPIRIMFEEFSRHFYRNSPYGQQTILGTTEDLKNPSLSKMDTYFDTYYVAKNMALVLAGDFDPAKVKPIIEEKFGIWRSGDKPADLNLVESPFNGRVQFKGRFTPVKLGALGFQTIPKNHPDEQALQACSNLLTNIAGTGLLDQLRDDNKLTYAWIMNDQHTELGGSYIFFVPKVVGQSLKNAEKETLLKLGQLKKGEFSDELFTGVKTEMKKQYEKSLEDMSWRTYAIMDAFLYGVSWEEVLSTSEKIDKLTKEQVVAIANKYFGDNYLAFYSKMGFPKKDKIEKPPFKPVQGVNRDKMSEYARKIESMPTLEMAPKFIDFEKDLSIIDISKGVKGFVSPNLINKIFSIQLVYGKGTYADPLAAQAVNIFEYASPKGLSLKDFKKQLQLLGCDFYTYADQSTTRITINGLDENLDKTLDLLNNFIYNMSVDENHLKKLVEDLKMEQKFEGKDVANTSTALNEYALYGKDSKYLTRLGLKDVEALKPEVLLNKLKEITGYSYEVHYCGILSPADFSNVFKKHFTISNELTQGKGRIEPDRLPISENTILFVDDKKAIQSQISIFLQGNTNDELSRIQMAGFNNYLDGSMSSIIFQEIREFRSLAYNSSGKYNSSFYFNKPGYFRGGLSTQADKTLEALAVYTSILTDMPEKPERIGEIRKNLTLSINAEQPSFRYKSMSVSSWLQQGYKKDPRETRYNDYLNMDFSSIENFYQSNIKGKPWLITVVGNKEQINMEELKKFGKIVELKTEELYRK